MHNSEGTAGDGVSLSGLFYRSARLLTTDQPLRAIEDGEAQPTAPGYSEWNVEAGYAPTKHWRFTVGLCNLFDTRDDASVYYYASRLPGEPASGVEGLQVHPLEPRAARFSVTRTF